jgi:hypothetical protein
MNPAGSNGPNALNNNPVINGTQPGGPGTNSQTGNAGVFNNTGMNPTGTNGPNGLSTTPNSHSGTANPSSGSNPNAAPRANTVTRPNSVFGTGGFRGTGTGESR